MKFLSRQVRKIIKEEIANYINEQELGPHGEHPAASHDREIGDFINPAAAGGHPDIEAAGLSGELEWERGHALAPAGGWPQNTPRITIGPKGSSGGPGGGFKDLKTGKMYASRLNQAEGGEWFYDASIFMDQADGRDPRASLFEMGLTPTPIFIYPTRAK